MRRFILISSSCLVLAAGKCPGPIEYVYVKPEIPGETLTPCPISEARPQTVNELAALATSHRRSAECANGKIEAVAEVLQ